MSKVALAGALGLLLFFPYLTAIRPAYAFAYALCLLFVIAWAWPRIAIRGVSVARGVDPGTPTVGEVYEETFEVRRKGWIPAPWVEVRDLSQIGDYQPGRVISLGSELAKWKARGVYRRRGWMALGPTSTARCISARGRSRRSSAESAWRRRWRRRCTAGAARWD